MTLFDLTPSGVLPRLAESWAIDTENKRIRVRLSENCGWSDGTPISAQEVVVGIRLAHDGNDNHVPARHLIADDDKLVDGSGDIHDLQVRALSDRALEIRYEQNPDFLLAALSYPFYTPAPTHAMKDWPSSEPPSLVSGSYVIADYDEARIELIRNPHACRANDVGPDRVTIVTKSPHRELVGKFVQGQFDFLPAIPRASITALENAKKILPDLEWMTLPRLGGRPGKIYQAALAIFSNA